MKKCLLISSLLLLLLVGCGHHRSRAWHTMDRAENIMEAHPDSALCLLHQISSSALKGEEEQARYALLKSIALDKNFIDSTTFVILQPAIDYYSHHGTPDDKLRTCYYQGRIYLNAGREEEAAEAFMRAEHFIPLATDTLTMARTLYVIAQDYDRTHQFEKHIQYMLRAAHLFRSQGEMDSYAYALLSAFNRSVVQNNRQRADSLLPLCRECERKGFLPRAEFFIDNLVYEVELSGSREEISKLLAESDSISLSPEREMIVANAYRVIGKTDIALEILNTLEKSTRPFDTLKFLGIKSLLLEKIGDYKATMDIYKDYMSRMYLNHVEIFDNKLHKIEKLHESDLKKEQELRQHEKKSARSVIIISVLLFVVIILSLSVYSYRLRMNLSRQRENVANLEKETLAHRIETLESEKEHLLGVLESREQVPEEVYAAIRSRVEMLNALLAEQIVACNGDTGQQPTYEEWAASQLADKEIFMNQTRLAFQASHPRFIQKLESAGLSEDEINYICLYAIGLNGKEVGRYLQRAGHFNISSVIRRKLGLGKHDTNLSIYVRGLLHEE